MDYAQFRRSTNIDDDRKASRFFSQYFGAPWTNQLQSLAYPTPLVPPLPIPPTQAYPGSLSDQAGLNSPALRQSQQNTPSLYSQIFRALRLAPTGSF